MTHTCIGYVQDALQSSYRAEFLKLFLIDSLGSEWGQIIWRNKDLSPRNFELNCVFQIHWFWFFLLSDALKTTRTSKEYWTTASRTKVLLFFSVWISFWNCDCFMLLVTISISGFKLVRLYFHNMLWINKFSQYVDQLLLIIAWPKNRWKFYSMGLTLNFSFYIK